MFRSPFNVRGHLLRSNGNRSHLFGKSTLARNKTLQRRSAKVDTPERRTRRADKFVRILRTYVADPAPGFEELTYRFAAVDTDSLADRLTLFAAFLHAPDQIISNRVNVDQLSDRYSGDCLETVLRFINGVATTTTAMKKLLPKIFKFVGLAADGNSVGKSRVQSRRRPGVNVSFGHLRNQMCHLVHYLRFLTAGKGRSWDTCKASTKISRSLRLLKRLAYKEKTSAEAIFRKVAKCSAIGVTEYQRVLKAQESAWKVHRSQFRMQIVDPSTQPGSLRALGRVMQANIVAAILLRTAAQRPDQVGEDVNNLTSCLSLSLTLSFIACARTFDRGQR